jgi:hypothetical protein
MMLRMTENDESKNDDLAIGKRVKAARGSTEQAVLAKHMKDLGYKWSQATVWAVESGKRTLKLAEARDLSMLLGISILDLLEDQADSDAYTWIQRELAATDRSIAALTDALVEWGARRTRLFSAAAWLSQPENLALIPESRRGSIAEEVRERLDWTVQDGYDDIQSEDWMTSRADELDEGEGSVIDQEPAAQFDPYRDNPEGMLNGMKGGVLGVSDEEREAANALAEERHDSLHRQIAEELARETSSHGADPEA